MLAGYISRRQGHWTEAEADFTQAVRLDPRNPNAVNLLVDTQVLTRRYFDAIQTYDRAIAAGLQTPIMAVRKAAIAFAATGNAPALHAALASAPADLDVAGGETPMRIMLALIDHDYDGARAALAASPRTDFQEVDFSFYYPRAWYEAVIARAEGDQARTRISFATTRRILNERLKLKPEEPRTLGVLAQVDAGLGRKEEALREGRRAVELMPLSKDAYDAPLVLQGLAQVYTWTGEKELAIETVKQLLSLPGYLSYGYLRIDPAWEPLRNEPKFQELIAL